MSNKLVVRSATSAFRRQLRKSLRNGFYALRYFGERGNWQLAVLRGNSLFVFPRSFLTIAQVVHHGTRKTGVKATKVETSRIAA